LAGLNGGDGFHIAPTLNSPNGNSCGQWRGLSTVQNSGYGIYLNNLAQIRLSDSFFGGDTLGEVYVLGGGNSTYSHSFTHVATELAGSGTSGFGWWFDPTSTCPVEMVNCTAIGHHSYGLFWNCPSYTLSVVGGSYTGNNTIGIYNYRGPLMAHGVEVPITGSQINSIYQDSGNNGYLTVVGNHCGGDSSVVVGGSAFSHVSGNI
jgi:hypothetical protein